MYVFMQQIFNEPYRPPGSSPVPRDPAVNATESSFPDGADRAEETRSHQQEAVCECESHRNTRTGAHQTAISQPIKPSRNPTTLTHGEDI